VLRAYPGLVMKEALAGVEPTGVAPTADVVVWDAPETALGVRVANGEPRSPVLALVSSPQSAQQALRAGARGALLRSAPPHEIAPAALAVAAGHWVLGESLASTLLHLDEPLVALDAHPSTLLSPREHEVLSLLSEGLSNREIAIRLSISHHTAKFHVNAILDKLGATTRTEAVVLAARSGLLTL
jgi:two-component system, NarL family, nitrate/nitrite response regulator NarL